MSMYTEEWIKFMRYNKETEKLWSVLSYRENGCALERTKDQKVNLHEKQKKLQIIVAHSSLFWISEMLLN